MISRRLLLLLLILSACKPASQPNAGAKKPGEPQVRATVVSLRTTLLPSGEVRTTQLVIAEGKARDTSERDVWRLYDTGKKTVTVIDDVNRTYNTESFEVLARRQRAVLREPAPAKIPPVVYKLTGETRSILGITARQAVATVGAYRRELWVAEHPAIPRELYAMIQASAPPTSPLAPTGAAVQRALLELRGFPLVDKYELPFGKSGRFAGEKVVASVVARDVPQSVLRIPKDYRDVTPKSSTNKKNK